MTNYQLEEFKTWLEVEPSRKGNLSWDAHMPRDNETLQAMIERKKHGYSDFKDNLSWWPYCDTVLKWKNEVDERERERESKLKGT